MQILNYFDTLLLMGEKLSRRDLLLSIATVALASEIKPHTTAAKDPQSYPNVKDNSTKNIPSQVEESGATITSNRTSFVSIDVAGGVIGGALGGIVGYRRYNILRNESPDELRPQSLVTSVVGGVIFGATIVEAVINPTPL